MVDDLKQQASELYKERSPAEAIPTSDGQSTKRMVYLAIALVAAILVLIYAYGGFRRRPDPVVAAYTPPPLVKEAPPPELMDKEQSQPSPTPAENAQAAAPAAAPSARQEKSERPAAGVEPPARKPANQPIQTRAKPTAVPAPKKEAASAATPPPPAAPVEPKLSDIEIARRELAKDIVIEKNPALAKLIDNLQSKGWHAEPEGSDAYQVTFSIVDDSTGSPVQYVWRVTLSTRTVTPLSYYARKLS
jgi:hypothetical protein